MATLNVNKQRLDPMNIELYPRGERGSRGISIKDIEQTKLSTESSGINEITVTLDNDEKYKFNVTNGEKGEKGERGEKGEKGDTGAKGEKGDNITVKSNVTTYAKSNSSTTKPADNSFSSTIPATDTNNKYLWTRVVTTFSDNTQAISYSVSSTMDSIDVGGRNLVPNSTYICTKENTTDVLDWEINKQEVSVIQGQTYTLSQYYNGKRDDGQNDHGYAYAYAVTSDGTIMNGDYLSTKKESNNRTRIINKGISKLLVFTGGINHYHKGDKYQVKLEVGNIATDWTPAPEDMHSTYSTNEVKIGTFDGKALYRRCYIGPATIDSDHWFYLNISTWGIGSILNLHGTVEVHVSKFNKFFIETIPRVVPDNISGYGIGFGDINQNQIGILFGTGYGSIKKLILVIEYTKETIL